MLDAGIPLEHGLLRLILPRKRPSRRSIDIRTQDNG